jgi:predicted HTH domain antitoxin
MSQINLEIPDEVVSALRLPPDEMEIELRKELAVSLYARRILPLGKARLLSGLSYWEFNDLLGNRKVCRDYTGQDLETDLDYARSHS